MDFRYVVLTVCLLVFSIVNIPLVPAGLRMLAYTVIMIPSLSCSSLTYSYYSSMPETMYSVLTVAVQSVIAWHMVYASLSYVSLISGNFILEDVEDNVTQIHDEGNITNYTNTIDSFQPDVVENFDVASTIHCPMLTFLYPRALVVTAAVHLQMFRLLFEICPLLTLSLNYEVWTIPINLSIVAVSSFTLFLTTAIENSLCYERELLYMLHQLGRTTYKENFHFAQRHLNASFNLIGVVLELIIQSYRKSKKIKLGKCGCLKPSNRISPVNMPSSADEVPNTDNESTPQPKNHLGSVAVVLAIVVSTWLAWYVADFSSGYFDSLMVDFVR